MRRVLLQARLVDEEQSADITDFENNFKSLATEVYQVNNPLILFYVDKTWADFKTHVYDWSQVYYEQQQNGQYRVYLPLEDEQYTYIHENVTNNGSKEMDVNGNDTAQNFRWEAPSTERWEVEALSLLIYDAGSMDATDFGSISGSGRDGLQINLRQKGVVRELTNLVDNMDIAMRFQGGLVAQGEDGIGFLDDDDVYFGKMYFERPLFLNGLDGDYIEFKVRDNLSALTYLRASVHARKEI